ncbi:MAG: TROVE domain-containing protein [Gordonia sp. (in: high G+C Gram-positive bacteria)]|uniref:TROVE domain-containing protein n=1 Tax=Gordonia sp. (in: high G+C Gram-positive bacteria) TaxID=84139 RepID=UPI0039E371A6
MDVYRTISTGITPQTRPADPRQEVNGAGGHTFTVTPLQRLRRFLLLGTEGGTYYTSAAELTADAAPTVLRFAAEETTALVREIVAISQAGRAPKQQPALFALAAAAGLGDDEGRRAALDALPDVARTGTHSFLFAGYVEQFRGWGRALRRAVGDWYLTRPVADVAHQAIKYRQREGWSHRDLLRLAHPVTDDAERRALFAYLTRGDTAGVPRLVEGYERVQADPRRAVEGVVDYGLSWEMLPDAALASPPVWEALLERGLPQTALLRQLPRLTRLGLLAPGTERAERVAAQLTDPERLRRARVHPVNVLVAQRTYASGRSARGESTWVPSTPISDALDAAFYAAFAAVEPSGRRHLSALDVSGSMTARVSGLPISAREASAALALVTAATEPQHWIVGFTGDPNGTYRGSGISELDLGPRRRLDDVVCTIENLPFGATDCALPITWAHENGVEVDVFSVYTDNETWCGPIHPHQALARYRREVNPDARMAVVGMTATGFSIADPDDAGILDVVGFDSATPALLSDFARGSQK